MKEHPILFSGSMVRAILEGKKTQTRRVMKIQPTSPPAIRDFEEYQPESFLDTSLRAIWPSDKKGDDGRHIDHGCKYPYGRVGHRLWVREEHYRFGHWEPVAGVRTRTGRMKWKFVADTDDLRYDPPSEFRKGRHHLDSGTPAWHKRLARFMPRWASRIMLEIVNVRVERLQDISEQDIRAEGVTMSPLHVGIDSAGNAIESENAHLDPWDYFSEMWDKINGKKHPWKSNPWLWVIKFKRVTA